MIGGIVETVTCPHCHREQQVRLGSQFSERRTGEKRVFCEHDEWDCGEPFVVRWEIQISTDVRRER